MKQEATVRGLGGKLAAELKENFRTKSVGAYLTAVCWLLGAVALFVYAGHTAKVAAAPDGAVALFSNPAAISCGVIALLLPIPLCMFRKSAPFVPVVQLVCSFIPLLGYAINPSTDLIDYVGTIFIDGFSLSKLFDAIPPTVMTGMIFYLLIFLIASVALYLPQNKSVKKEADAE